MEKIYQGLGNYLVETDDIEHLSSEVLSALDVGDRVVKITGKQKHLYEVSYKGEGVGEGICLTYTACGYIETISYDFTSDGWAFNSKDVWQAE